MNTSALILMFTTWILVTGACVYFYYRVLNKKSFSSDNEQETDVEKN